MEDVGLELSSEREETWTEGGGSGFHHSPRHRGQRVHTPDP